LFTRRQSFATSDQKDFFLYRAPLIFEQGSIRKCSN
jgi:hypothetical protein